MALTTIPVELLTLDDGVTVTVDDNSDNLTLTSTDADANAGPSLMLFRNSSSPADSDRIGTITYRGKNDAAENVDYIVYDSFIVDASDGTEDAELDIRTMVGGLILLKQYLMRQALTLTSEWSQTVIKTLSL